VEKLEAIAEAILPTHTNELDTTEETTPENDRTANTSSQFLSPEDYVDPATPSDIELPRTYLICDRIAAVAYLPYL